MLLVGGSLNGIMWESQISKQYTFEYIYLQEEVLARQIYQWALPEAECWLVVLDILNGKLKHWLLAELIKLLPVIDWEYAFIDKRFS